MTPASIVRTGAFHVNIVVATVRAQEARSPQNVCGQSPVQTLSALVESLRAELQSSKSEVSAKSNRQTTPEPSIPEEPRKERGAKRRRLTTTLAVSPPSVTGAHYQGLTSPEYSFQLASLNLARLDNPASTTASNLDAFYNREEAKEPQESPGMESLVGPRGLQDPRGPSEHVSIRVFTQISHARARELVVSYSETVGLLHNVLDIQSVLTCVDTLYAQLEGSVEHNARQTGLYDVIVIRLILLIALRSEQTKNKALLDSCYEGAEEELNDILSSEHVSLRGVILILLGAIQQVFSGCVRMAWRLCGIAASLAMEIGLHRSMSLQKVFPDGEERMKATRVIWSIFVLDHEWSSTLGLPRHMSDGALDSRQLQPVGPLNERCVCLMHAIADIYLFALEANAPYLTAMTSYCAISSKIVNATASLPVNEDFYNEEQFEFVNYQIERWQRSALDDIQPDLSAEASIIGDPPNLIRIMLYLRANQLRILLLRPLFFSEAPVKPDQSQLSAGVETAVSIISLLTELDARTDIYSRLHPFFSHFLASAASLLLLNITYSGVASTSFGVSVTRDVRGPIKDALSLTAAYSESFPSSSQLYRRVLCILRVLTRLRILGFETDLQAKEPPVQHAVNGFAVPGLSAPVDLDTYNPTSSSLFDSEDTISDHRELELDWLPLADTNQDLDTFLDGNVWAGLDELLRPHLQCNPALGINDGAGHEPSL
ncbi:fungal specific transcription factor domain-containing protein [Aspergillus undulatus]|uniref:fungal specific transcription factor domain-containing protein n=1 Tax=Aspergillus undulatus TaxID=1810928 RepID=UPI003CCE0C4E